MLVLFEWQQKDVSCASMTGCRLPLKETTLTKTTHATLPESQLIKVQSLTAISSNCSCAATLGSASGVLTVADTFSPELRRQNKQTNWLHEWKCQSVCVCVLWFARRKCKRNASPSDKGKGILVEHRLFVIQGLGSAQNYFCMYLLYFTFN